MLLINMDSRSGRLEWTMRGLFKVNTDPGFKNEE
jgi:hypothetical protein